MILNFVGAFVLTFFLSRGILLITRRLNMNIAILFAVHLATLAMALFLPFLKSGIPGLGFIYPVAQAIWFAVDVSRLKGKAQ